SGAEDLEGKTILLYSEQGLGDTIQFCRYVPLVAARGARVYLQVQAELVNLLKGLAGAAQVLSDDAAVPLTDYHCPLLSLPGAFKTDLASIPAVPRHAWSDAVREEKWCTRLGSRRKPRVGMAWSGNPGHVNDRNRSVALKELLPLLDERLEW